MPIFTAKTRLDPVLSFFHDLPDLAQQKLGLQLHQFILGYPQVHGRLRYKIPFYDRKKWVCYLNPIAQKGFELVFLKGHQMADPQKLLSAKGRKMVKGILLETNKPLSATTLDALFMEAFLVDDLSVSPKAKKRKTL